MWVMRRLACSWSLLEREAAERGRLGVGVAAVGAGVTFYGLRGKEFIGSVPG